MRLDLNENSNFLSPDDQKNSKKVENFRDINVRRTPEIVLKSARLVENNIDLNLNQLSASSSQNLNQSSQNSYQSKTAWNRQNSIFRLSESMQSNPNDDLNMLRLKEISFSKQGIHSKDLFSSPKVQSNLLSNFRIFKPRSPQKSQKPMIVQQFDANLTPEPINRNYESSSLAKSSKKSGFELLSRFTKNVPSKTRFKPMMKKLNVTP